MRNYWLKIALGALGVFVVGMALVYCFRTAKAGLVTKLQSDSPLTIPLVFVPFKLDGKEVGTMQKVVVLRDSSRHISGIDFYVDLKPDAQLPDLNQCLLHPASQHTAKGLNLQHSFLCSNDTSGLGLVTFGGVHFGPDQTEPVLLPEEAVREMRGAVIDLDGIRASLSDRSKGESAADAAADSADAAADRALHLADSIRARADSIRDAALQQVRRSMGPPPPKQPLKPAKPAKPKQP
jgi:hypothetical protein